MGLCEAGTTHAPRVEEGAHDALVEGHVAHDALVEDLGGQWRPLVRLRARPVGSRVEVPVGWVNKVWAKKKTRVPNRPAPGPNRR